MKHADFLPDYQNLVRAATNHRTGHTPLYEHNISPYVMEQVLGKEFRSLVAGDTADLREYFRHFCGFFREMGYDTVSFEGCITPVLVGGGSLGQHKPPTIKDRDDFEKYPWEEILPRYQAKYGPQFAAVRETLPLGMKIVGGVGNGIFEVVQDLVSYTELCYISSDDPELYEDIFKKVGALNLSVWQWFLKEYGDICAVARFGDDLGYKSGTLLSPKDTKKHILPQYKPIIDEAHRYHKPFLLHSCGCIFDVMEDIIALGVDAKHSNEDQIAPFPEWPERYGDRIAFFGGIDTDAVCRLSPQELRSYIYSVCDMCVPFSGFAFGSGNSIPDYVPAENYTRMVEIFREYRGER